MSYAKHHCQYEFEDYCGVEVCTTCGDHRRLARCYCGWSKTSPGRGRQELEEMGERIGDEDGPFGKDWDEWTDDDRDLRGGND